MTGWTIDFGKYRDAWRWIADGALCGAKTRAVYPCRSVPVYRPSSKLGKVLRRMHARTSPLPARRRMPCWQRWLSTRPQKRLTG